MGRILGSDDGNGVAILGAESAKHVQDLTGLANGLADVAEGIGELLQLVGVLRDIHVALKQTPELRLQVDSTVELIITELIMDRIPDDVRRSFGGADDGADVFGNRIVEPAKETLILHDPIWITEVGGGLAQRKDAR